MFFYYYYKNCRLNDLLYSFCFYNFWIAKILNQFLMDKENEIKDKILKIFTPEDLFHKAFLRPLELILRTKSIDPGYYNRYDNGLPQGLMIA